MEVPAEMAEEQRALLQPAGDAPVIVDAGDAEAVDIDGYLRVVHGAPMW